MTSKANQKRIENSPKRERGQHGNNRGKSEQQRQRARSNNTRAQTALAKARAEQEALEKRIAAEQAATEALLAAEPVMAEQPVEEPVVVDTVMIRRKAKKEGAEEAARVLAAFAAQQELKKRWSMGQARSLVRAGYHPCYVQRRTGWEPEWTADAANLVGGTDGKRTARH